MNFEEHAAKPLLVAAGVKVPRSLLATTPEAAAQAATELGPVVVKAQVPTGKRGKAGGIKTADDADCARTAASEILGMRIGEHTVERVLVEQRATIVREYYAAVVNDPASKNPLVMFSIEGGMDIEEVAVTKPDRLRQLPVDIRQGLDHANALQMLAGLWLDGTDAVADLLVKLYQVYSTNDAELVEINPLAVIEDGKLVALDCKFVLDDSGIKRQPDISLSGAPEKLTGLEARGQALGLKYVELDGDIGVLANGAGLTMTTMDVISHHGGAPANFLEIGGEAYTKAKPALELLLDNPRIKSLVVNFCGAFARTDVMTEGVINAWQELEPTLPVFFSVHGTGAKEARALLKERMDIVPYATMDEAIIAAIDAAGRRRSAP
jgi:succinyl-CoA synthetase beta subunit